LCTLCLCRQPSLLKIFFMKKLFFFAFIVAMFSCNSNNSNKETIPSSGDLYKEVQTGGVKIIPIETPKGKFNVWTKTIGNNPKIKLLLLNGGPGATHEYFECFENFLLPKGVELIYYDQLGCGLSDNPKDTTMWDLARYVEEVEQVRKGLNLSKDNFYLLGHSWGGILAMQYDEQLPGVWQICTGSIGTTVRSQSFRYHPPDRSQR
jgi:proline iminopeptidase